MINRTTHDVQQRDLRGERRDEGRRPVLDELEGVPPGDLPGRRPGSGMTPSSQMRWGAPTSLRTMTSGSRARSAGSFARDHQAKAHHPSWRSEPRKPDVVIARSCTILLITSRRFILGWSVPCSIGWRSRCLLRRCCLRTTLDRWPAVEAPSLSRVPGSWAPGESVGAGSYGRDQREPRPVRRADADASPLTVAGGS